MVLNDPENLARAINKTYFQHFPEEVRPKTCISRNVDEIKRFIDEQHGKVVIKPLQGSGGKNVFLVGEDERANLNQMIDAVLRDGYCVAQEYLPAAAKGDVRLFVMNGRPLMHDGKYAAFRRVNKTRRRPQQHALRRRKRAGRSDRQDAAAWSKSCGRSSSATACSWSASISSPTS